MKRNKYYYFKNLNTSPTVFQVAKCLTQKGWKRTFIKGRSDFSDANFDFPSAAAETLEFKDQFALLCQNYCPQEIPLSFPIHDQNWREVVNVLSNWKHEIWILKPALLNNGQHIHLFEHPSQIERHFLSSKRIGGPHVLQQYLHRPHLLQGPTAGHKYSIRMFVVLSTCRGAYLYPEGYFNIALKPYTYNQYEDLRCHLTNEHLFHEQLNIVQIPTWKYDLFHPFYPKIIEILSKVITGLATEYPLAFGGKGKEKIALFGFDFMVDEREKIWLLEANHGPCFPISMDHPLQQNLYQPFWSKLTEAFIIHSSSYDPEHDNFKTVFRM